MINSACPPFNAKRLIILKWWARRKERLCPPETRASLGAGTTWILLPHHARDEPGLAPRRLDVFFQEAVRILSDISRPRIGPGTAFVVVDTGRLAGIVAVAAFQTEIAVVAAQPVDRNFLGAVARLDHAGAAHARDAAIVLGAHRHVALEPTHRAAGDVGRVVEAPRPAAPVALAHQRTIRRVPGRDRRTRIIATRTIEIGLGLCRSRRR